MSRPQKSDALQGIGVKGRGMGYTPRIVGSKMKLEGADRATVLSFGFAGHPAHSPWTLDMLDPETELCGGSFVKTPH